MSQYQLGVLCIREEALVPAPTGGAPSTDYNGPLDDLNVETPALRLEPMLGSNPTVSDVHIVLYSLFNIVGAKSDQQVNICSFAVRCDRMWPSTQ